MATFHRKTLSKSKQIFLVKKDPVCHPDHCDDPLPQPPPPPPPPLSPANQSLSPFLILMFCGLAVSLTFIVYLTLYKWFCSRTNSRRNPTSTDEINEVFVDEDVGPVIHHPIWLINTIGLERSVIESIEVFKYKRDEGLIEGKDCSVCLSEFQDDESLRLLPKCSHAFHVPCIDTWLQSHKNCPLCRAPIIKNMSNTPSDTTVDQTLIESSSMEENTHDDSENVDHTEPNQVFQVENNGEVEKCSQIFNENNEESQPKKRSVSMDQSLASINAPLGDQERGSSSQLVLSKRMNNIPKSEHKRRGSSSSISICSRVMKSSSFGRSSRKASSFIKRSYSSSGNGCQNRSY